ncbi:MAG: BMP family ABC transporter substrate-binding protein, partial [Spirochaetales bacterium]|nr:BMP family ABC transporter substrate-binding protein [Spirochaetales bacterium]
GSEIEMKYLEPKAGGQDREQLLRVLAEQGYNLIYGIGFMFSDPLAKVAKDFPNVHFAIVDGFIPDLNENSNITCLLFKEHEGSFLVGAVAGLMNNGGKIGFIGGMDIPLIHKFEGGYIAGALYVNSKLRDESMILAQYIGKDPSAFKDAPAAYNIASNMYKQGAAVIYHAAGASGDGLFQAAEKYKKLAIGVDSDQGLIYSTAKDAATRTRGKYILTSMLKRVDNAVYSTATELINNGKVNGGYHSFGLKENGVGFAVNDYNKDKLSGIMGKIESIKQKIINGEIVVPDDDSKVKAWAEKNLK